MKHFIEIIETFNLPSSIIWKEKNNQIGWLGEFQTPNGRFFTISIAYNSNAYFPSSNFYSFEFYETPEHVLWMTGRIARPAVYNSKIGDRKPTGRGEAFYVYSSIFAAMKEFLLEVKPERITFKGATPKQTQFYMTIMKHYAAIISNLGYKRRGAGLVKK